MHVSSKSVSQEGPSSVNDTQGDLSAAPKEDRVRFKDEEQQYYNKPSVNPQNLALPRVCSFPSQLHTTRLSIINHNAATSLSHPLLPPDT